LLLAHPLFVFLSLFFLFLLLLLLLAHPLFVFLSLFFLLKNLGPIFQTDTLQMFSLPTSTDFASLQASLPKTHPAPTHPSLHLEDEAGNARHCFAKKKQKRRTAASSQKATTGSWGFCFNRLLRWLGRPRLLGLGRRLAYRLAYRLACRLVERRRHPGTSW